MVLRVKIASNNSVVPLWEEGSVEQILRSEIPDENQKLKEENEGMTLSEIWKAPSDEEMLKMKEIVDNMVAEYQNAKNAMNNTTSTITDSMPF